MEFNFKDTFNKVSEKTQQTWENAKTITNEKVLPKVKETSENTKVMLNNAKEKISTTITEEEMLDVLNKLYVTSINGIDKVSLPVDDLVEDYMSKNKDVESACKSLIKNSIIKCTTSGFLSGLGGLGTMILTLPANLTSVMYVQLRMCCAVAKMAGYDIHSDQVQTMIYACLTGSAVSDILKNAGIQFGTKLGTAMIKKIPGKTLTAINQKVGFRFVTKFGSKGVVNLGKMVPVVGGIIGGGFDAASTNIIGKNAYNIFVKGELPENDKEDIVIDATYEEVDDIDTKMIKENQ